MTDIKIPVSPSAALTCVAAAARAVPGLMTTPGMWREKEENKKMFVCGCDILFFGRLQVNRARAQNREKNRRHKEGGAKKASQSRKGRAVDV